MLHTCYYKNFVRSAALLAGVGFVSPVAGLADDDGIKVICPNPLPATPKDLSRSDVYKETPFKAGEISTFEVSYMGMLAGYGTIEVQAPQKHGGIWHRVFHVEGKTGDWFSGIFVAHDEATAFVRPWDSGVSKFYLEQREGKLIGKSFIQKKWLDFNHDACKVKEKTWMPDKAEEVVERDVQYGAIDAIGSALKLRTMEHKIGKSEKFLVYTSEKNWYLETVPMAVEEIKVPAGTFPSVKLRLQTYIGKDLQQKGDVFAWIHNKPPYQLVQIQGDIKIGSVFMRMSKYQPGQ